LIEEAAIVRIRCRSPASRRFAHTAARLRRVRSALWGPSAGGKRAVELVRVDHSVSYPCVFEPTTDLERQRRLSDPSGAGDQDRGQRPGPSRSHEPHVGRSLAAEHPRGGWVKQHGRGKVAENLLPETCSLLHASSRVGSTGTEDLTVVTL
jgi:hypothetical protein